MPIAGFLAIDVMVIQRERRSGTPVEALISSCSGRYAVLRLIRSALSRVI